MSKKIKEAFKCVLLFVPVLQVSTESINRKPSRKKQQPPQYEKDTLVEESETERTYTTQEEPVIEEDLEAIKRAARVKGMAVIYRHLESFLTQNPGATYAEWIADLHPENVGEDGLLDERLLTPGNPWEEAYQLAISSQQNASFRSTTRSVTVSC